MKKTFYSVLCITLALFSCAGTPNPAGGAEQIEEAAKEELQFPEPEDAAPNTEEPAEETAKADEKKTAQKTEPALSAERASGADEAVQKMSAMERPAAKMHVSETVKMPPVLQKKHFAHAEKLNPAEIDELPDLDGSARSADTAQKSEEIEEPVVYELEAPEPKKTVDSADEEAVPPEILNLLAMLEAPENEDAALPAQSESELIVDEPAASETPAEEAHEEPIPPSPVPSRAMSVKKNQLIDVVYPGKGWIYQGNIDEEGNTDVRQRNFVFGGRKIGAENQTFTVSARNAGAFLLHFYKNDALTGSYIDDYLEVNVENEEVPLTSRIKAPDYAKAVPPAVKITSENTNADTENQSAIAKPELPKIEEISTNQPNSQIENTPPVEQKMPDIIRTAVQNTNAGPEKTIITEQENFSKGRQIPETSDDSQRHYYINSGSTAENSTQNRTGQQNSSTDIEASDESSSSVMEIPQTGIISEEEKAAEELLTLAKKQYEAKEYEKALETLKQFFAQAVLKIDEGLFLQGNILESKSNVRNIKNAIDSYDLIVRDYPASSLWDRANKRSIYLKRFYINIR